MRWGVGKWGPGGHVTTFLSRAGPCKLETALLLFRTLMKF